MMCVAWRMFWNVGCAVPSSSTISNPNSLLPVCRKSPSHSPALASAILRAAAGGEEELVDRAGIGLVRRIEAQRHGRERRSNPDSARGESARAARRIRGARLRPDQRIDPPGRGSDRDAGHGRCSTSPGVMPSPGCFSGRRTRLTRLLSTCCTITTPAATANALRRGRGGREHARDAEPVGVDRPERLVGRLRLRERGEIGEDERVGLRRIGFARTRGGRRRRLRDHLHVERFLGDRDQYGAGSRRVDDGPERDLLVLQSRTRSRRRT